MASFDDGQAFMSVSVASGHVHNMSTMLMMAFFLQPFRIQNTWAWTNHVEVLSLLGSSIARLLKLGADQTLVALSGLQDRF